jgi:hypothetical protein
MAEGVEIGFARDLGWYLGGSFLDVKDLEADLHLGGPLFVLFPFSLPAGSLHPLWFQHPSRNLRREVGSQGLTGLG